MLMLLMLLVTPAQAGTTKVGNAPFCIMDNDGNLECFHYTMTACQDMLSNEMDGATCVRNSK